MSVNVIGKHKLDHFSAAMLTIPPGSYKAPNSIISRKLLKNVGEERRNPCLTSSFFLNHRDDIFLLCISALSWRCLMVQNKFAFGW